jgi:hypothetical protein
MDRPLESSSHRESTAKAPSVRYVSENLSILASPIHSVPRCPPPRLLDAQDPAQCRITLLGKGLFLILLFPLTTPDNLRILWASCLAGESIERCRVRDNTDEVGLVSKRWVLTPPKGLGTIFRLELGSSCLCATLNRRLWIV